MKLKFIKFLSFLFLLLFFAYIGLLAVLKASFNTGQLRNRINNEIANKIAEYNKHYLFKDKEIKFFINGGLNLMIFPKLKLVANDVVLENIQYRDILIHSKIKKIEINLNFSKFFAKKLQLDNINISGVSVAVENNKLPDFYMTKKTVKKIVKLEEDEVVGVGDKLKNIFGGGNSNVEDGYREIEVEEDLRIDLDNIGLKNMLVDLFKISNSKEFNFNRIVNVNFSNSLLNMINDTNIQKEFKDISGNLKVIPALKETKLKVNFTLNNINGLLNVSTKEIKDKFDAKITLNNNQNDKITVDYSGKNLLTTTFDVVSGKFNFNLDSANFNNLVQWLLPVDSPFYYRFDYKKSFKFSTNIEKNKNVLNCTNLKLLADDVNISGKINVGGAVNEIALNIEKLDLNQFMINSVKSKAIIDANKISIFKYETLEELVENIEKNQTNSKNTKININIKNLVKDDKALNDSILDFEIINNNYVINNVKLNFNDFTVTIDNKQAVGDYYFNDFKIKGKNFNDVAKVFNVEQLLKLKEFELNSKVFVYNNIFYLYDFAINSAGQSNINGSFEYSANENNRYLASRVIFDNLNIKMEKKNYKTLKEHLLWLNNFTSEAFLDLTVNNLSYNDLNNIYFKSKIHYNTGFLDLYELEKVEFENIKNLNGNISLNINEKMPEVKIDLSIDEANFDLNLLEYIFDMEKYKNILLKTEIDTEKQEKYWVNRLFASPTWNEINGSIVLKLQNLKVNDTIINDVDFKGKIEDGSMDMEHLTFKGLGGSTELKGKIDLKNTRNVNLVLTDTVYNIQEISRLLYPKQEQDILSGTIGIGGIFKAGGFNTSVFSSSINLQAKFVGQNLFVKKLGLKELKDKLGELYTDEDLLNNFKAKDYILNDSGTMFNNFTGSMIVAGGVNNLSVDATGSNFSDKLISKIDNSSKNIMINIVNTSVMNVKIGKNTVPLYTVISFKEDFANRANLIVNTSQIDEYVAKIRANQGK